MKEIKAIIKPFMLASVCEALRPIEGLPGLTVSHVAGWGGARSRGGAHEAVIVGGCKFAKKTKVEMVVVDELVDQVLCAIARAAHTGNVGDGKIFVYEVREAVKIRTGERDEAAI